MIAFFSPAAIRRRSPTLTRALVAALGVGLVLALLGAAATIYTGFKGGFADHVVVYAELPPGQPVDAGNQVEYLGAAVGTVGDAGTPLPGGSVRVKLYLDPSSFSAIPANATATVAPSSLFGKENVVLQAPQPSLTALHSGQVIPASGQASQSLQGTLTSLDNLLTGLHPAELDQSLNALSTALQGQAPSVTSAVGQLDRFMQGFLPQLPTLDDDIYLLSPLLNGVSEALPSFLQFAGNISTTATTLTEDSGLLGQLLASTTTVAGTGQSVLETIAASLHATLAALYPLLGDVAANPKEIPQLLSGVDQVAKSWAPSFTRVPDALNVTGQLIVENPTALIFAGTGILNTLGSTQAVVKQGFGHLDPPTYTAADCPRYGADAGPNCSSGSTSAPSSSTASSGASSTGSGSSAGQPSSSLLPGISAANLPGLSAIAGALSPSGGSPPAGQSSSIDGLLLGPLMASALH